ncbi:hypothetical protein IWW36_000052 [Coemansia brasiliensis]|uniref:Phosphoglycerate mutase-like protein n=1 Tax=Coemansia brasiliensis TaxID=2650707 RepID=A0A9W8IBU6_9FUNG|nr:hypothetical protein IWW36_000052 [Coemansia brasiliensis]
MQIARLSIIGTLATLATASNSAFATDVEHYAIDDSSYTYCNPGYPSAQAYAPLPGATLELVQAVVRHGDRTPVNYIPNNDNEWRCDEVEQETYLHGVGESEKNTTGSFKQIIEIPKWNQKYGFENRLWSGSCEEGELTDHGKHQHSTLGAHLRSIYVDKLGYLSPELSSADEIYLRTTHIWRTKNSAESLLGALWPKRGITPTSSIPLHTFPSRIETMYGNSGACPRINALIDDITKTDGYQRFMKDQGPLMARLMDILSVSESHWKEGWGGYFDVLNSHQCHQFNLPCKKNGTQSTNLCVTAADLNQVNRNANYETAYKFRDSPLSQNLTRLYIGSFVGTLRDQMKSHIDGHSKNLKFALYSGHDSTVWPLLGVLGASDQQSLWPPYASNLLYELWKQQDGSHVVRVIYNGQVLQTRDSEHWCDLNACPIDQFFKRMEEFIPSDITSECAV